MVRTKLIYHHKPFILTCYTQKDLLTALIDSGTDGDFMDLSTPHQLNVRLVKLDHSPSILAIDMSLMEDRKTTHRTVPITLITSSLHHKEITFLITSPHKHYLTLGKHVPQPTNQNATLPGIAIIHEQKAMEDYIQEALEQSYITPSTSPACFQINIITYCMPRRPRCSA